LSATDASATSFGLIPAEKDFVSVKRFPTIHAAPTDCNNDIAILAQFKISFLQRLVVDSRATVLYIWPDQLQCACDRSVFGSPQRRDATKVPWPRNSKARHVSATGLNQNSEVRTCSSAPRECCHPAIERDSQMISKVPADDWARPRPRDCCGPVPRLPTHSYDIDQRFDV
jgi:hypothetical protein